MLAIALGSLLPLLALVMVAIESFVPISTLEAIVKFIDNQRLTININAAFSSELSLGGGLRMSYVPLGLRMRMSHTKETRYLR